MAQQKKYISTVVFDYGGVLGLDQDQVHVARFCELTGIAAAEFERRYYAHRHSYDAGTINGKEYWELILERPVTGADFLAKLVKQDILSWMGIDEAMMGWAKDLQARGVRTAILSNMPMDQVRIMHAECTWLQGFAPILFSSELGVSKPDPKIYHILLAELAIPAKEILFVDNMAVNVVAAQALGIHSVHFRDFAELKRVIADEYIFVR